VVAQLLLDAVGVEELHLEARGGGIDVVGAAEVEARVAAGGVLEFEIDGEIAVFAGQPEVVPVAVPTGLALARGEQERAVGLDLPVAFGLELREILAVVESLESGRVGG